MPAMTNESAPRLFELTVPRPDSSVVPVSLRAGSVLFVMGANGTGKSSIMHRFYRENYDAGVRISAHRRTWFSSSTVDITARQKQQQESNMRNAERDPQYRWRADYDEQRTSMAIFNLVDAENSLARRIADAMRRAAGDEAERPAAEDTARRLAAEDSPLGRINHLLRSANLPVGISIEPGEEILAARDGGDPYRMAEMSDGERSAVLLAAEVLTAKRGSLFLIDEPERHLHRSIITPLIGSLLAMRVDCSFVVATHEVGLPLDFPHAQVLLLRRPSEFSGGVPASWDADLLKPSDTLDEQLQRDLLGARRRILFVEGRTEASLDRPLYSRVFPDFTVVSKGSQAQVLHATKGLRGAKDIAWVDAFGLVDRDNRVSEEVERLRDDGVFALDWYSVESIYYHPVIQRRVAERRAAALGSDATADLRVARQTALQRIGNRADHLVRKRTVERARQRARGGIPTEIDLDSKLSVPPVDVPVLRDEERAVLTKALREGDLRTLIERYPIRETGALDGIARGLKFESTQDYERAVLRLLGDDEESLEWVRSQFEPLVSATVDSKTNPA